MVGARDPAQCVAVNDKCPRSAALVMPELVKMRAHELIARRSFELFQGKSARFRELMDQRAEKLHEIIGAAVHFAPPARFEVHNRTHIFEGDGSDRVPILIDQHEVCRIRIGAFDRHAIGFDLKHVADLPGICSRDFNRVRPHFAPALAGIAASTCRMRDESISSSGRVKNISTT